MVLVSYIHVLSAAFLMGLAAAAPIGSVNMLAIRRGVIGGWRHTLACGIGSIAGDLILFSLVLLGGGYFLRALSNPGIQTGLAAMGAVILLPLEIYFLVRAVKDPCGPGKRSPPLGRRHSQASDRRTETERRVRRSVRNLR